MPNFVGNLLKRLFLLLFSLFACIWRVLTCKWLRRPQRIGELPTFVTNRNETGTATFGSHTANSAQTGGADSWSNWSESNADPGISEQIEEYRRRRQEELQAARAKTRRGHPAFGTGSHPNDQPNSAVQNGQEANKPGSDDLFAELQPTVKAPKKLVLKRPNNGEEEEANRRNLFQVQEENNSIHGFYSNQAAQSATEFGELEDGTEEWSAEEEGRTRSTSWLDEEDNVDFDQLDAVERAQRQREREERKQQRQAEHAQQLEERRKKQQQAQKVTGKPAAEHRIQF